MSKRNKEGDEILRKKNAKLRFKRLVRVGLANNLWINEVEEGGITLNVKKNVAMLVRKKHKTGILTMAQKGLLASSHNSRTIEERKKLCIIVAGLGCFTQVPPKIRARLVPHLHFLQLGAGRVLMKEGDVPTCVYFVVSGEIEMSRKILNKVTRKYESKPEAFCGPGDWIGEVELLEDDLRMNTYKAQTNCEILVLDDIDFRTILMPHVKKVWIEKKKAIASLSYLKFMNESQIVSACKFGLIRQYDPLDTIYPEEKDSILHAHFVLSGECVLLQCLHMKLSFVKGEVQYELPQVIQSDSDNDEDDGKPEPFDVRELLRSSSSLDEMGHNKKKAKRKAEFAKIEAHCKFLNQKPKPEVEETQPMHYRNRRSMMKSIIKVVRDEKSIEKFQLFEDYDESLSDDDDFASMRDLRERNTLQRRSSRGSKISQISQTSQNNDRENISMPRKLSSKSSQFKTLEVESEESEIFTASSTPSSVTSTIKSSSKQLDDANYATHFIDVGSMCFGGLFGVGEKCDHRVVMARTTVQCLLIPRYWLMEDDQNPGHIWQRMRFYLDRCIPSRETLFQDFIKTRKWAQFKEDCVEQFTHSMTNPTKIEDIPIIIRIVKSKGSSHDIHH
ncbi:uncharacterized protein LOC117789947 [Drosophila innubila]|uniref:uncharacterized protein LOC117789947 n=1 Tax=Drosophila innubila TaxID=198719 RepID=UPI00148DF116|nr:uncharacterized protein LOC117789947 [Drosophila innubila]